MPNVRSTRGYHMVDSAQAEFLGDSDVLSHMPVFGPNGAYPVIHPYVGLAVAYTGADLNDADLAAVGPLVGLGISGSRLAGKLMQVEWDGGCAVQHRGFMYFPFVTGANQPVIGKSVVVDGTGKVQASAVVPAVNQVQTGTQSGTWTSGTFTVTFDGYTTANIAFGAIGAQVATALCLLPNVGAGGFTGSGSAGGPFVITAASQLAGQLLPALVYDTTGIVGGGIVTNVVGTPGAEAQPGQNETIVVGFGLNPWTPLYSGTPNEVLFCIVKK
jgi:hypothetical protein